MSENTQSATQQNPNADGVNQAQASATNQAAGDSGESTILAETMAEFDPAQNAGHQAGGDAQVIESDVDLATYKARIAELENEIKSAKEAQARINAEAYNAQKRMEQETEKSKKFALQKFAKDLLDVVDNLERAIISVQQDADADDAIMEGVKLTHKSLLGVLSKNGIAVVDPQGEKFNADLHEAVGVHPEAQPDHIGEVLQKGYTLHDRLLRPAMVRVGQ